MIKKAHLLVSALICFGLRLSAAPAPVSTQGELLAKEGSVDFARARTEWVPATNGLKLIVQDRLRTLALSRATLRLAELGRLRVNELTTLEILPPQETGSKATLDLKAGAMYFFTRDKPREFLIQMPHAIGASRGTEFLATVEAGGRSVLTVFDGEVELVNPQGRIVLLSGEQGTVEPGQAPVKTAVIEAVNIVQWWLYYPGILDLNEVPLNLAEKTILADSLSAYRNGDLLTALQSYPAGRVPGSDAERIYYAGLLLGVGQVQRAESALALNAPSALASALRRMINSITLKPSGETGTPMLATEWLAQSYEEQARFDLPAALRAAREAVRKSASFGFGWTRVAELEFAFGRIPEAERALEKAVELSPRNPEALALRGFILTARNRITEAIRYFDQAIEIDGALGNAWLGRGLCRIREGDSKAGRDDLQTAAALEPNRSLLRSYLGKAFGDSHDLSRAEKELRLAQRLDVNDPTAWLYLALLDRQANHINDAVRDLEKSLSLNDNRRVYRSRLLLDQDRAVRSSSLANIYQSAGMVDVSVREAARAVSSDYGNYSAHLFLAESFNALRDPTRFNLRYETAWFNELLLANLLAPVGAGMLSQHISLQEYARLFEADKLGFNTATEVRSDGRLREIASQYGSFGSTSYSLDLEYQFNKGVRDNNELSRLEWYSQIKQQLTDQDSVFLLTKYQDYSSGDNFQYFDSSLSRPNFKFTEVQAPMILGAYHREWQPGVHTLFLAGRLVNEQELSDRGLPQLILTKDRSGRVIASDSIGMDVDYQGGFESYTTELNQIFQTERHTFVLGGRFQSGEFRSGATLTQPGVLSNYFPNPPADSFTTDDFQRVSAYGYYTWQVLDSLFLTSGLAYDRVLYPENHRSPPLKEGESVRERLSPKAALIWNPLPQATLRGAFSRSLGGVSYDESVRLEPTQLAGFNQSFRTIIPESIVGSVSAPAYESFGAALDLKFGSHTYLGFQGEVLRSNVERTIGVFDYSGGLPPPLGLSPPITPSSTPEHLDYEERSLSMAVNQLVSKHWSFGAQYKFTISSLDRQFPAISTSVNTRAGTEESAGLHQARAYALFNHSSGFFTQLESELFFQTSSGYSPELASENLQQLNCYLGFRFPRQKGELTFGLLNVTDADYRLNPLNPYMELPRERVLMAKLKLYF